MRIPFAFLSILVGLSASATGKETPHPPLPDTAPLQMIGDIASQLVDAADRFLLNQLDRAAQQRTQYWHRDLTSREAYETSIKPNRDRLRHLLGLHDDRVPLDGLSLVATTKQSALIARGNGYNVDVVKWLTFGDVHGEGLLLTPTDSEPIANVVAIPHCDITPDQLCGLEKGFTTEAQFARRLAESGCRVVVPLLIDRSNRKHGISNREWLHRAAYEMGRTMTGYEVNKVLSLIDSFRSEGTPMRPIGVIGWGDGGLIAWYAGAVDPRIDVTAVSGAFGNLNQLWKQPVDRMVFSVVKEYGDVGLATMIAPRHLLIETGTAPQVVRSRVANERGAPYEITKSSLDEVQKKAARARQFVGDLGPQGWLTVVHSNFPGSDQTLSRFLQSLSTGAEIGDSQGVPSRQQNEFSGDRRLAGQRRELDRHTQDLLRKCHFVRNERFWEKLDTSSLNAYQASVEPFRNEFYDEIIGRFEIELLSANPRTRLVAESPKWMRYEVVLDVFDGLFAYGLLTVPTGIVDGERRPVVVCQHGLEGRPQSLVGKERYHYYKAFATELTERGFVTFAPQNMYIFKDRFRTLQRKANSLGKTLFSLITPQHQQIVDWLQTLTFVDAERIAFYGMSYGGKTAMRVPPLVSGYCLTICSADFNEWVDKNASTLNPRSYTSSGEYEIFEWNLGHTFNYAEMAALIAPRPFMVERGHADFVADDWTVAWEYARVRLLYAARLGIPDRTTIEWFNGPHTIHGKGTYDFLHHHLNWPAPVSE